MPRISVIVPVYRAERFLEKCVESILSQSFPDFELILVDDGSPDSCPALCDGYAARDSRVRVIHQENRGVSAARNAGVDAAKGNYVTFCDGDDYFLPGHLERMAETAASGAEMVSCSHLVLESGSFSERNYPAGVWDLTGEETRFDYLLNRLLARKTGWEVWARMFSLDFLREHRIRFPEGLAYGEDLAFVFRVCLYCRRVAASEHYGLVYRRHGASAMAVTDAARALDQLNSCAKILEEPCLEAFPSLRYRTLFPLLHHRLLEEAYERIPAEKLPGILEGLTEKQWYFRRLESLGKSAKLLRKTLGGHDARRVLARCRFCRRGWIFLFRLENIINRILSMC